MLRTASSKGRLFLCWHLAPVLNNRIVTNIKETHNFKCYHTTHSHLVHDAGTTSKEYSEDSIHRPKNIESLIETWFYEVCPRGSLEASLPFRTEIRPLNPENYPYMNKVIIQLHFNAAEGAKIPSTHQLSQISDLYELRVGFDEDKANMKISCDVISGVFVPITCTLLVPLQFDLKINMTEDSTLSVEKMESNAIIIDSEKGDCFLTNIKSGSVSALCRSGNITCKSKVLGNVYFHTGKSGSILADKLQGSNIFCETEMGSVVVKSLYADSAIFRSDAGNVLLGQCHGQIYMQAEKSHLKIESLEGDLDVGLQSGSVEVHLSKHNKADVEVTTGDISLSFPEGTSTDLNLDSRTVVVDENVDATFTYTGLPHHKEGHIGEKGKALVNARTLSGTIYLKCLDWIHTTKLAFKDDASAPNT
ncbi:hypothetical protein BsWGS_11409 [Bradybaena similaris]